MVTLQFNFLDTNNLVLTIPFREASNTDEKASRLFEFMNLSQFSTNPTASVGMTRDIKLAHFVVNQPAFMYKGSLTFPDCEDALWIINSHFHIISTADKNNLINATRHFTSTKFTDSNVRTLQDRLSTTFVYRNFDDANDLTPILNKLYYNNAQIFKVSYVLLFLIFFFLN